MKDKRKYTEEVMASPTKHAIYFEKEKERRS